MTTLDDLWNKFPQKRNFNSQNDPQNKYFIFIEDHQPLKC